MLKRRAVTVAAALSVAALAALTACSMPRANGANSVDPTATGAAAQAPGERPNIVFVLTDDMSMNLMQYMPAVQEMQREGATFENYFVSNSLCCPSRASIFTGRYPHNTEILTNTVVNGGGYVVFKGKALDQDTFATDLQKAGYRTAIMGKYMNEYQPGTAAAPARNNPAGWDEWALAASGYAGFNYRLNQNGEVVRYGREEKDYLTDVISERGQDFVKRSAAAGKPFMLELSTFTPHKPYIPAPRHANLFPGLKAPQGPSYDKRNKNAVRWLAGQKLTPSRKKKMDQQYRSRAQTLQSVDEMIVDIRTQLRESGVADNTYIVFSSDNGYHMGEHSLVSGKMTAFDTDVNVPMVVIGPDVPAGATISELASNVDLRSTFGDVAGAEVPKSVDGQSLAPLWSGGAIDREYVLVEHRGMEVDRMDPDTGIFRSPIPPSYAALRTGKWLYIKYHNGAREFYNRTVDPLELNNVAGKLSKQQIRTMDERLKAMRTCAGQLECGQAQAGTSAGAEPGTPAPSGSPAVATPTPTSSVTPSATPSVTPSAASSVTPSATSSVTPSVTSSVTQSVGVPSLPAAARG